MAIAKATRKVTYDCAATVEDTATVLYTCPSNCRSEMSLLFISNANGNTSVTVQWVRNSGNHTINILGGKNLISGEYVQLSDGVIVFEPGDTMVVIPSGNATPHIDALATVDETFIPVG